MAGSVKLARLASDVSNHSMIDQNNPMDSNLILLGGIPRSGTTLTCALLNKTSECLALVEPMNMSDFCLQESAQARQHFIYQYGQSIRAKIHSNEPIELLDTGPQVSNTFEEIKGQKRKTVINGVQSRRVSRTLSSGFTLIIKHPNAFSALLSELSPSFNVYMQVRNPLSVLASWYSLDHPLAQGRAPMAEQFSSALKKKLDGIYEPLDRKLVLINWYFEQMQSFLPATKVIRYEDVIRSGGRALVGMCEHAVSLEEDLRLRNQSHFYDQQFVERAGKALLKRGGAWMEYYDVGAIESLLSSYQG